MAGPTEITAARYHEHDGGRGTPLCDRHLPLVNARGKYDISADIARLARDILKVARNGDEIDFEIFRDRIRIVNGRDEYELFKEENGIDWVMTHGSNTDDIEGDDARQTNFLSDQIIRKVYNAYLDCQDDAPASVHADGDDHAAVHHGEDSRTIVINNNYYGHGASGRGSMIDVNGLIREIRNLRRQLAANRANLEQLSSEPSAAAEDPTIRLQEAIRRLEERLREKEELLAELQGRRQGPSRPADDGDALHAAQEENARLLRRLEELERQQKHEADVSGVPARKPLVGAVRLPVAKPSELSGARLHSPEQIIDGLQRENGAMKRQIKALKRDLALARREEPPEDSD